MKITILISTLVAGLVVSATAQKLEKVQTKSVWGPIAKRVDLNNNYKLEAFNPATEIFYTLSNDDKNLYLQVQVQNEEVIEKAVKGSITFSISSTKKSEDDFLIKYPLLDLNNKINLDIDHKLKLSEANTAAKKLQIDTLVRNANKRMALAAKTVKIAKGKTKPDTLSIYNEAGIQILSFFDHRLYYNYQLTIPLSLLDETKNNHSYTYKIELTGVQPGEFSKVLVKGIDRVDVINGQVKIQGPTANRITALMNKTDFSAEYKLAKKQ